MKTAAVTEYMKLGEQPVCTDEVAETRLYARLHELWYAVMSEDERRAVTVHLVAKDARR